MKRPLAIIVAALLLASCAMPPAGNDHAEPNGGRITAETVRSTYPSPDDWHRLALYGNWDFVDAAAWREIAMQPDCDQATALAIFWKASPEYYVQFSDRAAVPEVNRAGYDLINLIRERWLDGTYHRAELAFDPEADAWHVDFENPRQQYGARVDQLMPPHMRVRLAGRRLPQTGFYAPGVLGSD